MQTDPSQAGNIDVDGELEVEIASAALNLTDDALSKEGDSHYDSGDNDYDNELSFFEL